MFRRVLMTSIVTVAALSSLLLFARPASQSLKGQQKTLDRKYDPVVVAAGEALAQKSLQINQLYAYRFDAGSNTWTSMPFQIDEVDDRGKYLREQDGIVDANDELVFMPGDAGDHAGNDQWLPDAGAQQQTRFELEVTDPLTPDKKGWVYLYQKVTSPPSVQGYIDYSPDPTGAGADTVKGASYIEGHTSNGWINYLTLPRVTSVQPQNLIDRLKVRLKGIARILVFNVPYDATEQDNFPFVRVNFAKGPVRGLREWELAIELKSGSLTYRIDTTSFVTQYFPYSSALGGDVVVDSVKTALAGISLIRISLDFSPNATGMKFFSITDQTRSFVIDGIQDSPNDSLQDRTWLMATGSAGTILTLAKVPTVQGTKRKLYYRDNANGGTGDGTPDTGDMKSYGDMGIRFDDKVTGTLHLSFDMNFFYLDLPDQSRDFADKLNSYRRFPMEVTITEQTMTPSAVADNGNGPRTFALLEAYPNPFAPTIGSVTISFTAGADLSAAKLRIYNLLGQEVARFEGADLLRQQEILWDGRDRFGRLLPAGVYFYELETTRQRAVKKLVLLR
jgi:hypothetical protein